MSERSAGDRARLFIALELPGEARRALVKWRDGALREDRGVRPIAPEHLHVTLCFLGWQPVAEIPRFADACRVAEGTPAAALSLAEAIWLPPRRPRVAAVKLLDGEGSLRRVQASLSRALEVGGWYEPEKRPFLPHVTVARVRGVLRGRAQALAPPPPIGFSGSAVILFRSHLAPGGARYEALERIGLGR